MSKKTRFLTYSAVLAAVSVILYFIEFPLPFLPQYLKMDLSDVPSMLAAILFSPLVGVTVELVKNGIHLFRSSSAGIGELANLTLGLALILPTALIIRKNKSPLNIFLGYLTGIICMVIAACLLNYFVFLPLYMNNSKLLPFEKAFPIIAYGIVPFNLVKATIISVLSFYLYKAIAPFVIDK